MTKEEQPQVSDDITCGQCGKLNGNEKVGTSWICSDCKVSANASKTEGRAAVDGDNR